MLAYKKRSRITLSSQLQNELESANRKLSYKIALLCIVVLAFVVIFGFWKFSRDSRSNPAVLGSQTGASRSYIAYTVKRNDTLFSLSARLKIPWNEIARANSLTEPYLIQEGQILQIPRAIQIQGKKYRIKQGDTLNLIARQFHTTTENILLMNPAIQAANQLQIGAEILIP
jgi:LysM repeat protein